MNAPALLRKLLLLSVAASATALSTGARGVDDEGGPVHQPKTGEFVFSLMPKAFQRTPDLEMTVNTEVTEYGRLLRTPSHENPMYYVVHSSGFKPRGDQVANEDPPPQDVIERALKKALGVTGYLPATSPDQKPMLAVLYFYGSHNRLDPEMARRFPQLEARYELERAMLVGGHFQVERMARRLEWGEFLTDRTPQYEYLRDQSLDSLYYVVASAYDYAALGHNERKLVWRTTMTVNARGVAMQETMVPLIAAAGPYFGRETPEPQIAMRRIARWGVSIGESKVIESDVKLPGDKAARKPTTPAKK